MIRLPGQTIPDSHGAHYTVVGVRRESAGSVLYDAEKTFLNYRYREREFYPADPDEQLPVLLRCPAYPDDDPQTAEALRELLEFEATQVLTLHAARWFPEPLDLLTLTPPLTKGEPGEGSPSHDSTSTAPPLTKGGQGAGRASSDSPSPTPAQDLLGVRRTALAMVRPHGDALQPWCDQGASRAARMRCAREALELLGLLHGEGLLLCAFDPHHLLVDPDGRLYYLGTDRIVRQARMPRLRRFFPPERFFRPWAAPEALDAQGWLDMRSDLYSWAALTLWLLAYDPTSPPDADHTPEHDAPAFDPREIEPTLVRDTLTQLARRDPSLLIRSAGPTAAAAVERWMQALKGCLDPDPQRRPASVASLDEMLFGPASDARPPSRRGWRKLFGR